MAGNDWQRWLMEWLPGNLPDFTPGAGAGIPLGGRLPGADLGAVVGGAIGPSQVSPPPLAAVSQFDGIGQVPVDQAMPARLRDQPYSINDPYGDAAKGFRMMGNAAAGNEGLGAPKVTAPQPVPPMQEVAGPPVPPPHPGFVPRGNQTVADRPPPMAAAAAPGAPAPAMAPPQEVKPPPGVGPSVAPAAPPMAAAAGPKSYTYGGHPQAYSNNIGNLVTGPTAWAGKGEGYFNKPAGVAFETFSDPVAGVAAAYKNMQHHYGRGATNLYDMGRRWLGVPDGADANSHGNRPTDWAKAIAINSGLVSPDAFNGKTPAEITALLKNTAIPINDPQAMARVMFGLNKIEHGQQTVPSEAYLAGVTGQPMSPMATAASGSVSGDKAPGAQEPKEPLTGGRRDDVTGLPTSTLSKEQRSQYITNMLFKAASGFFTPGGMGMSRGLAGLAEGMSDMQKAEQDWQHLGNGVMLHKVTGQVKKLPGVEKATAITPYQLAQIGLGKRRVEAAEGAREDAHRLAEDKRKAAAAEARNRSVGAISGIDGLEKSAKELLARDDLHLAIGPMWLAPSIPGTPIADVRGRIDTLKTKIGVAALNEMRELSKTGGAVGQVTEKEWAYLMNSLESLDGKMSEDEFRKSVKDILTRVGESRERIRAAYKEQFGTDLPSYGKAPAPAQTPPQGGPQRPPGTDKYFK